MRRGRSNSYPRLLLSLLHLPRWSPSLGTAASEDAPMSRADNYVPAFLWARAGLSPNPQFSGRRVGARPDAPGLSTDDGGMETGAEGCDEDDPDRIQWLGLGPRGARVRARPRRRPRRVGIGSPYRARCRCHAARWLCRRRTTVPHELSEHDREPLNQSSRDRRREGRRGQDRVAQGQSGRRDRSLCRHHRCQSDCGRLARPRRAPREPTPGSRRPQHPRCRPSRRTNWPSIWLPPTRAPHSSSSSGT
jgi:hypothetical protein